MSSADTPPASTSVPPAADEAQQSSTTASGDPAGLPPPKDSQSLTFTTGVLMILLLLTFIALAVGLYFGLQTFQGTVNTVIVEVTGAIGDITTATNAALIQIAGFIQNVLDTLISVEQQLADALADITDTVLGVILQLITAVTSTLTSFFQILESTFDTGFKAFLDFYTAHLQTTVDLLTNVVGCIFCCTGITIGSFDCAGRCAAFGTCCTTGGCI